ncbi:hypothetical protein F7725_027156 [Dissostichus mawsoni]|uniref:tRNA:m(4)X modification enzyme TRM13 n=1 Tax=Dissostichus mawsoni TaxID=36200 RepID=A0A7J5XE67_DISMA|nr:hypothetical protein F7725_027156 [Dissostichus mawsoni]
MAAPLPGRCGFFVEKKKRFCKMIVARGNVFCGEHATQVYYVENINAGPADGDETLQQVSLCDLSRTQLQSLLDKLKTAATGESTFTCELDEDDDDDDEDDDDVVVVVGLQCDIEDGFLSHPVVQEELDDPKNGDSANKHLKQQSSLLGHMEALGLLGRGRSFVEFGAGRGKLSHWIHEALRRRDP